MPQVVSIKVQVICCRLSARRFCGWVQVVRFAPRGNTSKQASTIASCLKDQSSSERRDHCAAESNDEVHDDMLMRCVLMMHDA